jgi:predicted nucleic-acid-binding Zn-ribbon protein
MSMACAKCGSDDVHHVPQSNFEVSIRLGLLRKADLDCDVCTNCGFVELYVADKTMLPHIAEKYPK